MYHQNKTLHIACQTQIAHFPKDLRVCPLVHRLLCRTACIVDIALAIKPQEFAIALLYVLVFPLKVWAEERSRSILILHVTLSSLYEGWQLMKSV